MQHNCFSLGFMYSAYVRMCAVGVARCLKSALMCIKLANIFVTYNLTCTAQVND